MISWIRNFYYKLFRKPNEKYEEVDSESYDEEGLPSYWKEFAQKSESMPSRGLSEYLADNPEKEKLFLKKLKEEWRETEPTPKGFRFRWVYAGLSFASVLIAIFFYYNFPKNDSKLPVIETQSKLEIHPSTQNWKITRQGKEISDKKILKGDFIKVSKTNSPIQLDFGENLHFEIFKSTVVQILSLPTESQNTLNILIQKGSISINSMSGKKPKIVWTTKNFEYTPTGTKARLSVTSKKEELVVTEGSFRRKNIHSLEETEILAGQEIIFYEPEKNNPNHTEKKYHLPGTVHLKNGKTYTGYYFQEKGKVIMKANDDMFEWSDSEIEFIE